MCAGADKSAAEAPPAAAFGYNDAPMQPSEPVTAEPVADAEIVDLDYASPESNERPRPLLWWPERCAIVYLGLLLPLLGLLFNAAPGDDTVPVDWQTGGSLAWLSLAPLPAVGWPILPFLLFGWAALVTAIAAPAAAMSRWDCRLGLWLGLANGLEWTLIVAVGLAEGFPDRATPTLAVQLVCGALSMAGLGVLYAAWLVPWRHVWHSLPQWARWTVGGLLIIVGLLGSLHTLGLLVLAMVGAAPASVAAFGRLLLASRQVEPERSGDATLKLLAWLLTVALHWLSWIGVAWLARRHYATLPTVEPDRCFVATAAGRSRRSDRSGGRQLRTLRAFESLLRVRHPNEHARLRRIYNRVGPSLAAAVTSRRRADVAHGLLLPFEWAARRLVKAAAAGTGRRRR